MLLSSERESSLATRTELSQGEALEATEISVRSVLRQRVPYAGRTIEHHGRVPIWWRSLPENDGAGRCLTWEAPHGWELPVRNLHPLRHVEVSPPYGRPDLDPLGERLDDASTVLDAEVVPLIPEVNGLSPCSQQCLILG